MDDFSPSIRSSALEKLAKLAVNTPEDNRDSEIDRLTRQCQHLTKQSNGRLNGVLHSQSPVSRVPMDTRELCVLVSLCKAAHSVIKEEHATRLVSQLSHYLPESHGQLFRPSPFLHDIKPSPWEALSYHLTIALLRLGTEYLPLRQVVLSSVDEYLYNCAEAINVLVSASPSSPAENALGSVEESVNILAICVSIVGFLEAAAKFSSFWTASEKLRLVDQMRSMFSENFMVAIETASSTVRSTGISDNTLRDWRKYTRRYTTNGRPLGAMLLQEGYMRFIKSCVTSLIGAQNMSDDELLDDYVDGVGIARSHDEAEIALISRLTGIIADEIQLLEDGSDYLQVGSPWQQRLAFSVKALALTGYLNCIIISEDTANSDDFLSWLEDTLIDTNQMSCVELATTTLKCITIVSRMSVNSASSGSRSLLRFIVEGGTHAGSIGSVAAQCLSQILGVLSQDSVITTLYSLGNVLSPGSGTDKPYPGQANKETAGLALTQFQQGKNSSIASLSVSETEDNTPYRSIIHAIVTIATSSHDEQISALAQSMLLQKIGKLNTTVDGCIIKETAALSLTTGQAEFQLLLKFYDRAFRDGTTRGYANVVNAVSSAMTYLSVSLERNSPLYRLYLVHLLESIVNKGDATDLEHERHKDITLAPEDISPLLKPLALLISSNKGPESRAEHYDQDVSTLFRDAWFNIAVHGISLRSDVGRNHLEELRLLAKYSPTLVPEDRMDMIESDIELNTVLRRGMGPQRHIDQKKGLVSEIPHREAEIKRLSYPKAVFLNAALLLETLRALSGTCTKSLSYFRDPALATNEMASCMTAIADKVVGCYLRLTLSRRREKFSVPYLSKELAGFFLACCHRIERIQKVAILCANRIILECPSALCEKHSLFALLELLTVVWRSCLEEELDEFEWKPSFTSLIGHVRVDLPDNYGYRRKTLDVLLERAKAWIIAVMDIAPLDIKGLLQTYLSASDDHDGNSDVSMGRSFALEMGSLIPQTDHRLGSLENYGVSRINVASNFIAQHTARQKYRRTDSLSTDVPYWTGREDTEGRNSIISPSSSFESTKSMEDVLVRIYNAIKSGSQVTLPEVRDALERAAAIVSGSNAAHAAIAHSLVSLPFQIFSRESINIGVSLWLGVVHENPRLEPTILFGVVQEWETTILRRQGLFDPSFNHVDPMYAEIELLPTNKDSMLQHQKLAQNILAPHLQTIQFFESHFNAVRLGNAQTQRLFCRFIDRTTVGLLHASNHPLARELHFRIICFCLKVLRHCTCFDNVTLWRLKHQTLSAALSWFKHPPRWSYGGNRLQLKAEDKILNDVIAALADASNAGSATRWPYTSLQAKQDLLQVLLENERLRLKVWLFPLDPDRKHNVSQSPLSKHLTEENMLRIAWAESPGLAIQLATRFSSPKISQDLRKLLLIFPEKAIDEPSSLEILFESTLPADVSSQLKYLLYWAPVNPIEGLTYFLPAYGNHPFILQYAMKALESHSLDVRFYFVPQLVQALRYDALGYVERYILETAKQSQLFAHQVIWNMKANSYKDEDSQIPDPLKPTLDRFMDNLIASFTDDEREFYEREFSFFNEITGISGKLRPYIKKSKPEKKEKIEEELRKIKVEVGVYLPSNPDGVVVGIDRKSGKPLQSHAKAPYLATFRIQKTRTQYEGGANALGSASANPNELIKPSHNRNNSHQETYEVWQSAIFKVGDDCRQDMLALQMIAAFRGIFANIGLDVWVFPYRVTSTAPGCGVIDVLPNSISRDMLGREAVNGLYDYFVSKYGGEDSIQFQEARTNFVKSMAAYSVISYLMQFKDRHNGNIMFDDAGHIIHIDFGFCFDIAPGGVRFERAPFKLTSEMVAVMSGNPHSHAGGGGSSSGRLPGASHNPTQTQAYKWFESLVVKAFLASRPYSTKLSHIVSLMLDSGLPCFKPETLKHFRDRFVLEKSEREAAEFMRELVRKSYMSMSTKGYDQFQLLTNGIPY
ncbi:1-phosphatidylinositol 4-kinase STT4 [Aspergillus undulatus]|uniref:1-phosphatidylinositol 4-kinase STT4 n=1 Tax=Aspergillus undulatus TaxID=1810928 RepID=UPI003CCD7C64